MLREPISPNAISAWRITSAMSWAAIYVLPAAYAWYFWGELNLVLLTSACVLITALLLLNVVWVPVIRWRRWQYGVGDKEIDLRYGVFIIRETLIPLNRVQHVDTRQGPIYRAFGLASVWISTAAGVHEIPALDQQAAEELRQRISTNARQASDDV